MGTMLLLFANTGSRAFIYFQFLRYRMSPVKPDPLQTEALHREAAWLKRRRGILALLGFGLGLSIGRLLWNLVLLNSSDLPGPWMDWFRARNLLLGGALALLPGIWGLGLRREQVRPGAGRRWPLAPLLALLGVAAIDICLQSYTGQSLFWQAVRARSGHQHQAREVSLYREEAAACRKKSQIRPGIVLAGSSQILYGVDAAELARRTGKPVYRRAVAGMFLPELAASRDFLVFHPENHVVLWLSGFDLGARDTLYADAIRPQATPTGIRHLLGAAGGLSGSGIGGHMPICCSPPPPSCGARAIMPAFCWSTRFHPPAFRRKPLLQMTHSARNARTSSWGAIPPWSAWDSRRCPACWRICPRIADRSPLWKAASIPPTLHRNCRICPPNCGNAWKTPATGTTFT